MIDLFSVGMNKGGWFAYPVNRPPKSLEATGNEVDIQEAHDLCKSLNQCVEDYLVQTGRNDPEKLLRTLAQHWEWRGILRLIADIVWKEAWDKRDDDSFAAPLRKNCLNLGRLIRGWL